MGALLTATGISIDAAIGSSIEHAAIAGRECLRAAALDPSAIDALFNVGVYRTSNMVEPSMAALIQRELGIHLDYVLRPTPKPVVSFDVMNGACGMLNAIQIASALLATGAEHVLLVSSDVHPSGRRHDAFPYAHVGGAMLLSAASDPTRGFGRLAIRDGEGEAPGSEGYSAEGVQGGRNQIVVTRAADYEARLVELGAGMVEDYVAREQLVLGELLLVTSRPRRTFGAELARRLEIDPSAVACAVDIDGDPHTSTLALAYHAALADGRVERHRTILFVGVGAGPTAACIAYRR
jgi:3-oxoacyl-[acyl-carrier-protein] synthase III